MFLPDRRKTTSFNPRPPRGERHDIQEHTMRYIRVSIHAPREGSDEHCRQKWQSSAQFQSTPPARGATSQIRPKMLTPSEFQSTPPARGATVPSDLSYLADFLVSIHAPREGSDHTVSLEPWYGSNLFQSTPPARGATLMVFLPLIWNIPHTSLCFNPRPPRGERRKRMFAACSRLPPVVSIHAPREGSDIRQLEYAPANSVLLFQSTPPARGATTLHPGTRQSQRHDCFNPRPPRGERHSCIRVCRYTVSLVFQSTPPARGATQRLIDPDTLSANMFQSTPPARGATILET